MTENPKRPRGAPKGNTNALKHGFYTRKLKYADRNALDTCDESGLQEEINMLRVQIRRVIDLSNSVDDFAASVNLLRVLSIACISLNRMVQCQKIVLPTAPESVNNVAYMLSQAVAKYQAERAAKKMNCSE